ncbi:MAG: branched-chain amino acid ABC transporter permease [Proteobacteria bacterium]|nr:branched-chain amino acid ABC transporter permease [Pseudomonadota bacterium]
MLDTIRKSPTSIWLVCALALLLAPLVFAQDAALSILCLMGMAIIFGLSFNILLGQGGMLSFGHAVYAGLGAYAAIHALRLAEAGTLPIPVSLVPLIGGLAGACAGIVLGYVTTRKAGITFAMISLGIVELVSASALMFPTFFGGEGGINANRVIGRPMLGISYGPQIEVYYLIACWTFVSAAGIYAFTRTPLGRMLNAVRDNPERAAFVGYDPRRVRCLALVASAFFAGIAGGLAAIHFEIVTPESVGLARSAGVLLATFIGGVGYFFGPVIGAIAGVLLTTVLPSYTKAWQLYFGALFILMVMIAPDGLTGFAVRQWRLLRSGHFGAVAKRSMVLLAALLPTCMGLATLIEMSYHRSLEAVGDPMLRWGGMTMDTSTPTPWLLAALLMFAGMFACKLAWPPYRQICAMAMHTQEGAV